MDHEMALEMTVQSDLLIRQDAWQDKIVHTVSKCSAECRGGIQSHHPHGGALQRIADGPSHRL